MCPEFILTRPHQARPGRIPCRSWRCQVAGAKGLPGRPDGCPLVRVCALRSWTAWVVLPSEPPPFPTGQELGGRHQVQDRKWARSQDAGNRPPRPPSLGSRVGAARTVGSSLSLSVDRSVGRSRASDRRDDQRGRRARTRVGAFRSRMNGQAVDRSVVGRSKSIVEIPKQGIDFARRSSHAG